MENAMTNDGQINSLIINLFFFNFIYEQNAIFFHFLTIFIAVSLDIIQI